MSSDLGIQFGEDHQAKYAEVLETWAGKVDGSSPDGLEGEWGAALMEALGEPINAALSDPAALAQWTKKGLTLPSVDTMAMFSQIAAKYTLAYASLDLLRRLVNTVKADRANPPEALTAAGRRLVRPSELISRAGQTVAQIFDMAKDAFNAVLGRFMKRKKRMTGRRRWVTAGVDSRHVDLNGQIRNEDEMFTYKQTSIYGPRPPGGSPADWSNCSCRLELELTNGKWV